MKEQCHLYCGCAIGCHDEELSEVQAGKNVCSLEESSNKTGKVVWGQILKDFIQYDNEFRF